MTHAAMIARYFPGFGDPYDLPVDAFLTLVRRIGYVRRMESDAPMTDREWVEMQAELGEDED